MSRNSSRPRPAPQTSSRWFRGILWHPVPWFLMATVAVVVGGNSLWERYEREISRHADLEWNASRVQLVQPEPAWAKTGLVEKVAGDVDPPTLLNRDLVPGTATLLQSLGWVREIRRIEKTPDGLILDLDFRDPVAQVFFPAYPQTLPIDASARVIDREVVDFSKIESLPRIQVFQPTSEGLQTWTPWPDPRIVGAAHLAQLLGEAWPSLGFYQIVSFQQPGIDAAPGPLKLYTRDGTVVTWGAPPGDEPENEASAVQKFQALAEFVLQEGPFDQLRPKQNFDLRSGRVIQVREIRTADWDEFPQEIK